MIDRASRGTISYLSRQQALPIDSHDSRLQEATIDKRIFPREQRSPPIG
jgi:hypothetical protein